MDERHLGSDFDDILRDEGILDDAEAVAEALAAHQLGEFRALIEAAEAGNGEAGMALWRQLASYREAGLDLREMPEELVAWFDRRLEELTDVPAFTKMGCRVTASEAARQATPHTWEEILEALCLKYEKQPRDKPGRPKSERKKIADWFLVREAAEEIAALWESDKPYSLSAACRPVAQRHGVDTRTVKRAVKAAGIPFRETTERFDGEAQAADFCEKLEQRGYRRLDEPDQPLAPGTFRLLPQGDRFFVRYF